MAAKKKPVKHIGFSGAVKKAEAEGYDKDTAGKIIGAAKAKAMKNPAAVKRNPNLKNLPNGKRAK